MKGELLMNRFSSGVLAGGLLAAAGMCWLMSDGKTRRRMIRGRRKAMRKTEDLINNVSDMF